MKNDDEVLKDTPDYEEYTVNEARLSAKELRELGYIKCGGGCGSKGGCCGSKGGCSSKKSCCKSCD